jgi:methyl-accepting chemotaxis protein
MRLSIAIRFALIGLAGSIVLGLALGGVSIWRSATAAENAARAKLSAIADGRLDAVMTYLQSIEEDLLLVASNPMTVGALDDFDAGWTALPNPESRLQSLYVDDNPYPVGERERLDDASDGSAYSAVHAARHPWFRALQQSRGYYDVFLLNTSGDLVYSVFKESDYATNMVSGIYADTDLAQAYRDALSAQAGEVVFFDFRPYAPSFDAPASFIATPVIDAQGATVGVLAFQMPIDRMNAVMGSSRGLGETGEAYLVGLDGVMRTEPRFGDGESILSVQAPNAFHAFAQSGDMSVIHAEDWRGEMVLAVGESMTFHGVQWGVVVTLTEAEALAAAHRTIVEVLLLTLGVTALVSLMGFVMAQRSARPIARIAELTTSIGAGNLDMDVSYQSRSDEVGDVARALEGFRQSAIAQKALEAEQAEREAQTSAALRQERLNLADQFEQSVGGIVSSVSSAAEQLNMAARSLSAASEETASQSVTVAAAAEEATVNVETVASAAEEMSASVAEIRRQAEESAHNAQTASEETHNSVGKVEALSEAAKRIGDVVTLIEEIAEQTNLLALNATIEAARAGEAGKGFAIVAQEVKTLASQTASATSEIADQINAIQSATSESAASINEVSRVIEAMRATSNSISAAVEEQSGATSEIAINVQEAAKGTRNVTESISSVNAAATESSTSSSQVLSASSQLSEQAEQLQTQVTAFLTSIRTA